MDIVLLVVNVLIACFWFYAACLRKTNSPKLDTGIMKLPQRMSYGLLNFMGFVFVMFAFYRLSSII